MGIRTGNPIRPSVMNVRDLKLLIKGLKSTELLCGRKEGWIHVVECKVVMGLGKLWVRLLCVVVIEDW